MLIVQNIVFPLIFALVGTTVIILIVPLLKRLLHLSDSSVAFIREMAIYAFILITIFIIMSKLLNNVLIEYTCSFIIAIIFAAFSVRHKKRRMERENNKND